jgi:hypothetical protein
MKDKLIEHQVQAELEDYFECARRQKCPPSMKASLYKQLKSDQSASWFAQLFHNKYSLVALSLVLAASVVFRVANIQSRQSEQAPDLLQAQTDLRIAMHYVNQISLKSLTEVNNKGLKPGLIRPLALSMASL